LYPIPAKKNLDLSEIADHWSREIEPRRSSREMLIDLGRAWWRGEFKSHGEITPLRVLNALFEESSSQLTFWVQGEDPPQTVWEHPDGSAEFLMRPVIPVPSSDPETWTDEQCVEAYEAIAQDWGHGDFDLVAPVVSGLMLTEAAFAQWIEANSYHRPKFWGFACVNQVDTLTPSPPPQKRHEGLKQFVSRYIQNTKDAGKLPTKVGLAAAAKTEGRKGGRDQLRNEFDQLMGDEAPRRGRPSKKSPI
jgi:hypothetical protein